MKILYLAWQDPDSRRWFPVGRLTSNDVYRFVYTKGAKESPNFIPFGRMTRLDTIYESGELFPLFANRLLPKTRPEYKDFLHWLNLQENEADPIALLARTEGIRKTDSLMVFPCPEPDRDGKYNVHFFSHGIRYLPDHAIQLINNLRPGAQLYLMPDPQNPHDKFAISLRTGDPATIVGYCPRYMTGDFHHVLDACDPNKVGVAVERVNRDAPIQLRLLCQMTVHWPENFQPCSTELYEPLA
ncbi:HIRAN domain-containing protein [Acidobacteria bacterium AH-259-O06]|nr:HIRAN domain-containing protein [Acidobacteria bacterium AH-259-O06]